ncbi:MAG: DUF58 domain-containing protein [Anaerolineae bacterium]|jgi:uncharacterized protein (DUF58 family)|nr:DUF58 domain-containing protein [Anaerolineae bacterium]MBT7075155.1 DUF58 domain-containing protein [Anaerolineae bacterium]MBT7782264.1 DUF58 domain-containing protein [Anaerolineae bacterium]
MRRNAPLILILYGILFIALVSMNGEMLALAIPLALYMLAGLYFAPQEIDLKIERELSAERITPKQEVIVEIEITNLGSNLEELFLEDQISPALKIIKGETGFFCTLKKGESISWCYTLTGPRGSFLFKGIKAIASDHFNIAQKEKMIETEGQIFIIPSFTRIKNIKIRPRQTRAYAGNIPARIGGPGVEFYGLREYQPGDSLRWVNWRASARHPQALYSNEYEQERVADVGIILDGREAVNMGESGNSLYEHSVIAAAALSDAFIASGNRVGLLLYGQTLRWTFPGYGHIQRERIMQSLARAEIGDSSVFTDLMRIPSQLFPINSQLVLISPLKNDDYGTLVHLRARGYQVMVISPNPVSYERANLPDNANTRLASRIISMERRMFMLKLQRAGVQALDWDIREPLDKLVKAHLGRPPAWRNPIK